MKQRSSGNRASRSRPVFSRETARELDRLAAEQYAMPTILLMENAAVCLAAEARRMIRGARGRVTIFCGPGNNGGDGFAMARHLHNAGVQVKVVLADPSKAYQGDAATNLTIARAMGVDIVPPTTSGADLIVDALLGTGLDRSVREPIDRLIRMINRSPAPVLAVDIPSGLDADTGEPLGIAVRADVTMTMAGRKLGFSRPGARDYLGRVIVADIGVPRELVARLGV
jgi:NAD(P)H-hydrate epimerase